MRWIVLLLAGSAWAADRVVPDFIPADTRVVIGVQLRRILDSPLGASLAADAAKSPSSRVAGIDFVKDIDEILIATTGASQNAPGLMVLKGRFASVSGKSLYHGVSVLKDPEHADSLMAFMDESTAIAGDAEQVRAAIDGKGRGAKVAAALSARVETMVGRYDFWGVGDHIPKPAQAGQLDSVDGFAFGAALRQGLELTAEIHLRSVADAEKMTAVLNMVDAMLKSQSGATKFNLQAKDGTLQLSLMIPEAELRKAIEAQKAALAAAITGQIRPSLPKPRSEGKILTDASGNTVQVTLPGGHE